MKVGKVQECHDGSFMAVQTGWRLKPTSLNKEIFELAGKQLLHNVIKRMHPLPGKTSECVVIPLPEDVFLNSVRGIELLLFCVVPNNDPNKADCIHNDYQTGNLLLKQTWKNMFSSFLELLDKS